MLFFIVFEVMLCVYGRFGVLFANAICSMRTQAEAEFFYVCGDTPFYLIHKKIQLYVRMHTGIFSSYKFLSYKNPEIIMWHQKMTLGHSRRHFVI